jgi:hypothetical protein
MFEARWRRVRMRFVVRSDFLIKFSWTVKPKYFKTSFPEEKG